MGRVAAPRILGGAGRRVSCIEDLFKEVYNCSPTHRVRVPGRVNLIGEHIDYNGLPVFPMALQRAVRIVFRPRNDSMVVLHSSDERFPPVEFEIGPKIERWSKGSWGNYVKAPAKELACRFEIQRGFDGMLQSDIPVAAGLSSSSAIVNAVGLALAHVNDVLAEPGEFAVLMSEAELFVGTRGGGMDQAISLGAKDDSAAKISFNPIRLQYVTVPDDWCFIIADSGEIAEKSGSLQVEYNLRRTQCEKALQVISAKLLKQGVTEGLYESYQELCASLDAEVLLDFAEKFLTETEHRCFRHVVTEAGRVEAAVERMLASDIRGFGAYMNASHDSLKTDYQVSTEALDELVQVAREGGAVGARLTGAGFGGCVVALVERRRTSDALGVLRAEYYERRGRKNQMDESLFIAVPSRGASVQVI
ncbi:MAG TPA: galactokinase [Gemmatimonadetes bacterium]|nr:galactokinase [Gemmatimonadota bacterium]HBV06765.1 galactokinase [Gemmatimonadota bacterium]